MKKWFLVPLFLLLAAVLVFTGCEEGVQTSTSQSTSQTTSQTTTQTSTAPTEPYGTITAVTSDFGYESTDPIFYESTWGWAWYDSLLRWDEDGILINGVTDSWEFDEATLTWTFHIHEGITFHNGDPLTAEDVKFSMDRFSDMGQSSNPWSYYLSPIYNQADSYVLDEYTYCFVQNHSEPSQQIIFAWLRILPKDYFETNGQDYFRANPVGSGPWKFVELATKQKLTLEANTDYWRTDEIPHYQYYVELMVPEQSTRIAMLKNGECDIAYAIDYDRLQDLQDSGFAVTNQPGPPGTSSLCIQGTWLSNAGATSDLRVRQALSYAINREEIVNEWYQGYGDPTAGQFYMYPGCFGWGENLRLDPYDPDYAMELLEDAGYPDAFDDPVIHLFTTAAGQDYMLLFQGYWEEVGIQVELEVLDSTIYTSYYFNFSRIQEGADNAGWIFAWTYAAFFNCTYHSANMYTSTGCHNCGDGSLDVLYYKAANETDPALAAQYFNEFQAAARATYVNIGICTFDTLIVYNPATVGTWGGRTWVSLQDSLNGIQHP